ncbi:MAG: hypothetical protein V1787_02605 [Candidatus Micrarchaeota archaeon]
MRQNAKLVGLRKLERITRGLKGCSVAPYRVYSSPSQFRMEHAGNSPRLMVRTDEAGRNYKELPHSEMPRLDIDLHAGHIVVFDGQHMRPATDSGSPSARQILIRHELEMLYGHPALHRSSRDRVKFIVHPTGPRNQFAFAGKIVFRDGKASLTLRPDPPEDKHAHRDLMSATGNHYFRMDFSKDGDMKWENAETAPPDRDEVVEKIVEHARDFVVKGIRTRRLSKEWCDAWFVTWKKQPTHLEFHDLREFR